MASRAVWKGQLRLSLVSIPVEMHSATESGAKISFRQIHEPTGKPIKYEKTVRGVGPVDASEIVKGYEYESDKYVLLDPAEVDAIKLETKKTLELVQFVGACEIPPLYFDKPYYLVPTDELAEDAYRVVRDALRAVGKGRHRPGDAARQGVPRRRQGRAATGCCSRRCTTTRTSAAPTRCSPASRTRRSMTTSCPWPGS